MKKLRLTNEDIKDHVSSIIVQLAEDDFKPDYIIGITRGGLVPALMISHHLDIPMGTLNISPSTLRLESNLYMPELATGYPRGHNYKKLLIVDDINDTGNTFGWLMKDWEKSIPSSVAWNNIWHKTVKFAVVVNNHSSNFMTDYYAHSINRAIEDQWVIFPWEEW